jgi:polysaccharide biosynthesis/export protein
MISKVVLARAGTLLSCLLLFAGCQGPFARTGPKFDARAPNVAGGTMTNMVGLTITNALSTELLTPADEPFTLGPGDRIEVEILGDPSTRSMVAVGPDGRIYFHILPGLDIWGLTLGQTKELLERELSNYLAGAKVAITLRAIESKRIWLLGRLRNPGVYPIGAPMTLLEAISLAGGLVSSAGLGAAGVEIADLYRSFVIREGQVVPVDFARLIREGDMTQNIFLQPDDFVYVPSTQGNEVYVLGAVRVPRPVPYEQARTLIEAITDAGGTLKDAYMSQVGIVRGSLSQPKVAVVSYKEIVSGKAPDVRLEPRDIVYVPFSPYRNLVKYVDLILATFARAEAINEGARAVSRDAPPVGINIGVGIR